MRFIVHVETTDEGEYLATCDQPPAAGHGLSPVNALDRLRAELRFQLELCPCSGIGDDYIEFDIQ